MKPDRARARRDSSIEEAPSFPTLLERHRGALLRFVKHRAGGLLQYESPEDIVQGIHLRALEAAGRFVYRGEREFFGWLVKVSRQHLARRFRFWTALRRDAGEILRITAATSTGGRAARFEPSAPGPGPFTAAFRREELSLAMKAFAVLLPRDQDLVRWTSEGVEVDDMAKRLGLARDAAKRARLRAIDRLRDAYAALSRVRGAARRRSE